ncbi:glycosyltransferase family 50 [Fusarium vanettenii 77-13-4]|uniref:GPI mannosyltransferase 1 n=1 Tax=Fusarium vanettenii (strain ATCC MYA-4622 / CBS 123669 / FGSC 9596 / NRRL 45880 / 77-13-4) TaxID=660122 RepID=C7YIZ4_FUSV7|nr:glycosyltransferase family 50 [Fusarium vanettenii 77-13-4]EEU48893.1 glycosyltransferase family 50 [Fusarium vanettenii 77-13-4]
MPSITPLLRTTPLFFISLLLRLILLFYGLYQDAHSALKYTDIDYLVFTDASRFLASGSSPYDRDTYRYTPLLAWLLLPTVRFSAFGKLVFAAADLLAGWLMLRVLRRRGMDEATAGGFAALWLWNPMVATISTRGSSEGLLGVLTMSLLWAVERRKISLAAVILGLSVHFKIYPFIYAPAIIWWMDDERLGKPTKATSKPSFLVDTLTKFCSPERAKLALISFATFMGFNLLMYSIYGTPFLVHTYFHHVSRIDHRHNFSPYNVLLYLTSATPADATPSIRIESLAFLPQLLLSCVLIPLALAKRDLATSMMAQTFAFVTFNKVCTSQYFLWYMVFLPLYLPNSSFLRNPKLGISALLLWVVSQAAWLQNGYQLEFLGVSTFFPGLWLSSLGFFLVNCWILGIIISDGADVPQSAASSVKAHLE